MKKMFMAALLTLGISGALVATPMKVSAIDVFDNCTSGVVCDEAKKGKDPLNGMVRTLINVLLFLIGSVSVIMIIIGGLRYVLSGGDSSAVSGAKNTILYAVVGLIVAFLSYAIVNFVIGKF